MLVQFIDSVAGVPVYLNPAYVVSLRPDPADPDRVSFMAGPQPDGLPIANLDDHLSFEPQPDVAPLLEAVDEFERYAVALVDKRHARRFTVFMGEIEESEGFKDFVPGKHDHGGLSQARYQRHHEAHVHWHLKRVAHSLIASSQRFRPRCLRATRKSSKRRWRLSAGLSAM